MAISITTLVVVGGSDSGLTVFSCHAVHFLINLLMFVCMYLWVRGSVSTSKRREKSQTRMNAEITKQTNSTLLTKSTHQSGSLAMNTKFSANCLVHFLCLYLHVCEWNLHLDFAFGFGLSQTFVWCNILPFDGVFISSYCHKSR